MYNRILIVGSTASGKTGLAKMLSNIFNLSLYSTDDFVYKEKHNIKYSEEERNERLRLVLNQRKWIIEGVHSSPWFVQAFQKADLVIILCLSRRVLFKRVIVRNFQREKKFEGLFFLLRNAYVYRNDRFIKHKELARKFEKKVIILHSTREIKNFLSLPNQHQT